MEQIDPKVYDLPPRTLLMKRGAAEFVLVIRRKSRIIMKDALVILKKAEMIRAKDANASVSVQTNAPVCSKSILFLKEKGIVIKNLAD